MYIKLFNVLNMKDWLRQLRMISKWMQVIISANHFLLFYIHNFQSTTILEIETCVIDEFLVKVYLELSINRVVFKHFFLQANQVHLLLYQWYQHYLQIGQRNMKIQKKTKQNSRSRRFFSSIYYIHLV